MKVALLGDEVGMPVLVEGLEDIAVQAELVVFSGQRFAAIPFEPPANRVLLVGGERGLTRAGFLAELRRHQIELLLCFSFDLILNRDELAIPAFGSWNLHGGRLPQHRGANSLNWVLIGGEQQTAMTMHMMVPEVDAGPVLAETPVPIPFEMDARQLRDELALAAGRMLPACLREIIDGTAVPRRQDPFHGPPFRRRVPDDGRIDWEQSDVQIHNLIRALVKPWPGAWTISREGERIVFDNYLTLAQVAEARSKFAPPSPRSRCPKTDI